MLQRLDLDEHARPHDVQFPATGTTLQGPPLGALVVGCPDEWDGQDSFMHDPTIAFPEQPRGRRWLICGWRAEPPGCGGADPRNGRQRRCRTTAILSRTRQGTRRGRAARQRRGRATARVSSRVGGGARVRVGRRRRDPPGAAGRAREARRRPGEPRRRSLRQRRGRMTARLSRTREGTRGGRAARQRRSRTTARVSQTRA